jgi:hypothetical protein
MEFISKLNDIEILDQHMMEVYQNVVISTPEAPYREMVSIFKQRWRHAMQMYNKHGLDGCSDEDSTVYVMGQQHNTDLADVFGKYDTTYDVIYFTNPDMSFDSYICNWNVFAKVNVLWKSVQSGLPVMQHVPQYGPAEGIRNTFCTLLYVHKIRARFIDEFK